MTLQSCDSAWNYLASGYRAIVLIVEPRFATTLAALERLLPLGAAALSAVLLLRFALDFWSEGLMLAVPFWILAAISLAVTAANVTSPPNAIEADPTAHDHTRRVALISLIPAAFIASSLDCTGLSLHG